MSEKTKPKDNLYWHSAFATSIQYELAAYIDQLDIETEHQLSKEALRIDMLVIKKDKNLKIEKNIGRLFKEHNLIEYKSPSDYLSPDDYNKVKGYAYLYAAFESISPQQLTLTFIVPEITPRLREYLIDENRFAITTVDDGINYVGDNSFSVQIIEQKKLSPDKNLFVGALSRAVSAVNYSRAISELHRQGISIKNNPFVEVVARANHAILKEVLQMETDQALKEVLLSLRGQLGLIDAKEVAKKMLKIGISLTEIALITDLDIDIIKSL